MKFRLTILLSLLALIVLAACTTPTPAATTEQPSGEPVSAPTDAAAEVYPAPAQESVATEAPQLVAGQAMYPDSQSGDTVTWSQAVAMMNNDEVNQIMKSQTLELTLNLKDGRSLTTNEPNTGELQIVIDQCGDVCASIEVTGP